ncbi:MAG: TonB-dependent receptor [Candidatus Zixiibacteriota bacterium]|nr:MAG: TonB-dependent receptor [candidate division Zixibacteria bacterium]
MTSKSSSARRQLSAKALCRYLFSVIAAFIFFSGILYAQSEVKISGKVIDSVSGAPISGVTVTIEDYGKTSISDFDGSFRFNDIPSGEYSLSAGRIGYKPSEKIEISVESYSTTSLVIELTPFPVEVKGQVVSASRTGPVLITRQGNVTIVEIGNGGVFSIDELQSRLPEIEFVEYGAQKFLRMRGSDLNSTEIKLNGRRINSVLSSRGDISSIPLGSVSKIEIVKGGGYDSKGLAGSVNFITADPDDDLKIETGAERGGFDREGYTARLSGPIFLKTEFSIDYEDIFDRGDFTFTDPRDSIQNRENNYYHDRKFFGVIKHEYDHTSLEFTTRLFKRNAGSPGPIFQVTPDARSDIFERELVLKFSRDFDPNSGIIFTGGMTNREIQYDSPRSVYNFIAYNSTFKESGRDLKAAYRYKGDFDFDLSGELRYESLDGEDHIRPEASFGFHSRTTNSIQSGITYPLPRFRKIKNFSAISVGYRREGGDGGDFDAPSATLRTGFDLFANPGFDISFSRSRRLPDMTDLFWKEDVFAEPNPALKSEVSEGYEIGFDVDIESAVPAKFRIARHFREYDDLIIWRRWAGNKFKPVNLSKAEISGWELSFESAPFSGPVTVFWSASYTKPLNKETEINHYSKFLTFRPIGAQTAGIQFRKYGIDIKLTGRHLGRRYQTEENTKSLPPVDLLDLRMGYTKAFGKVRISAGIDILNMGDVQYEILDRQPERPREYRFNLKLENSGGLL